MRELRMSGSVRGVPSNGHPYRDPRAPGKTRRQSPRMKLVSVAVDYQRAAAEPKDRISGCSSALPGGIWGKKVRLNFLSSGRVRRLPLSMLELS